MALRALHIISGPPGAGKTTVSKIVTKTYDLGVHLHGDDFWDYIASGFLEPWTPESSTQNETVMRAIASAAGQFVEGGYETVVDAVIGPWLIDPFRAAARSLGIPADYVVLRPDAGVALDRVARRNSRNLEESAVRHMNREFAHLGQFEAHVVDSATDTAEATAATVLHGFATHRFRIA